MQRLRHAPTLISALVLACTAHSPHETPASTSGTSPARYLYVWAGDKDEKDSDFLAVVDLRANSVTYGEVIATTPVGMSGTLPHHLEYWLPGSGELLFANGHHHERIFLFDTRDATRPRLARTLSPTAPYRYPHDFVRLPNGNVLVGFLRSEGPSPAPGDTTTPGGHGGLAEVTGDGRLVRTASAAVATIASPVRVYAFAPRPDIDRLVTTSAPMMEPQSADVVQIWRLSDFTLLRTLELPPARLPDGSELPWGRRLPFVPRALRDGSVLLNSYGCGFYRVTGLDSPTPEIESVYTIDVRAIGDRIGACGIPVVVGNYWVMTVGRMSMLVTLDIRDPRHPIEVSRLQADTAFRPHWLAKDPGSDRLIVGAENGGENRMLLARIDTATGRLSWDESLRSTDGSLGISFRRETWPHGRTGEAFGHAALFRP
jgi:hypothetical protein